MTESDSLRMTLNLVIRLRAEEAQERRYAGSTALAELLCEAADAIEAALTATDAKGAPE